MDGWSGSGSGTGWYTFVFIVFENRVEAWHLVYFDSVFGDIRDGCYVMHVCMFVCSFAGIFLYLLNGRLMVYQKRLG